MLPGEAGRHPRPESLPEETAVSVIQLDPPATPNRPCTPNPPGTLPERDLGACARTCPVCGSSSTYQTMDGRWGCVQCGSTWA